MTLIVTVRPKYDLSPMSMFLSNIFLAEHTYLVPLVCPILQRLSLSFFFLVWCHTIVCVVTAHCIVFIKNILFLSLCFGPLFFAALQ